MLLDAIVKLHDKIQNMKLGANRREEIEELEQARLRRLPLIQGAGRTGIGEQGAHGALPAPTLLGRAAGEPAEHKAVPAEPAAGIGLSGTGAGMHGTDHGEPALVTDQGEPQAGADHGEPQAGADHGEPQAGADHGEPRRGERS